MATHGEHLWFRTLVHASPEQKTVPFLCLGREIQKEALRTRSFAYSAFLVQNSVCYRDLVFIENELRVAGGECPRVEECFFAKGLWAVSGSRRESFGLCSRELPATKHALIFLRASVLWSHRFSPTYFLPCGWLSTVRYVHSSLFAFPVRKPETRIYILCLVNGRVENRGSLGTASPRRNFNTFSSAYVFVTFAHSSNQVLIFCRAIIPFQSDSPFWFHGRASSISIKVPLV